MSDLEHGAEPYDDSDDGGPVYEERRGLSPLTRILVSVALVIALGAFGGLVWFAYNEGVRSGAEEAAPLIRADAEPVKQKPEDAGGMAIPHQDKLVYNRIAPGQAESPVERLLPPPETPVERPTLPATAPEPPAVGDVAETVEKAAEDAATQAAVKSAAEASKASDAIAEVIVEADKAAGSAASQAREMAASATAQPSQGAPVQEPAAPAPPPAPPIESVLPRSEPAPEPAPEAAPQQAAVAPTPPPAPEKPAAPAGPAWRIQLASLTSEAAARAEWGRLQAKNSDLLGALELNVQRADLSKGTYYRIQAGPLADRAAAGDICTQLKSRKQDCLVVAP